MTRATPSDEPWILARERVRPAERSILGLSGLVPLWGFWDLVVRPWPAAISLMGLPLLLMGLAALALGLLFLAGAVLPLERELLVDPAGRRVIDRRGMRWLGDRACSTPFASIAEVALCEDHDTEGAARLQLVLIRRGERLPQVLLSRPLDRRDELENLAERLRAALQP